MANLDEAITVARQAVESTPHDHPSRAACLDNLANKLESRYEQTSQIFDLEEAIIAARQAVESTPENYSTKAIWLNNLANKLESQYAHTGQISNLDEAIILATQAVISTDDTHPNLAIYFNNLGNKLESRYKENGQIVDLEEAITAARQAVKFTTKSQPNQAAYLSNLATKLQSRFEHTGQMANLDEAIKLASQAVEYTPKSHPDQPIWLNSLGNMLRSQYEETGQISYLEEAISTARKAIESTPVNHTNRAAYLNNLGIQLGSRYERTGQITNLDEAIILARKAAVSSRVNHPFQATCLINLGHLLRNRYKRTNQDTDLEEAIIAAKEAIKLTPFNNLDRASYLNSLGISLEARYKQTRQMVDLEEATIAARQAIQSISDSHLDQAAWFNNLGNLLEIRYNQIHQKEDLEEAIILARQAIESTPENHPNQAAWLNNLGNKLKSRYEQTDRMADLEEACEAFHAAWHCQTAVPFQRIKAAHQSVGLLAAQGKLDNAAKLGQNIIDLLPVVNTKSLDRSDQQFVMSEFSGIAADVCALLIASDQPLDALEYLERGRAVIIGQLLDARSDLSPLEQQYPEMARRYKQLQDELNTPLGELKQSPGTHQAASRRQAAVAELDACIKEIRATAGNGRFLLGQSVTEMQECAAEGTIVVVNVTKFRSDAILVSRKAMRTFRLPRLLTSDAIAWLSKKWTGVRKAERRQKNQDFLDYLAWLWDVCVCQILNEIDSTVNAPNILPRIWWIGTGLGSSMPFHAAGMHSPGSTNNALSKVISSYTPSIKALGYARYRAKPPHSKAGSFLLVTMPTTPSQALGTGSRKLSDLPGVMEEKNRVTEIAGSHLPIESLDLPSADQVIDKLHSCYVAHFACHGSTDYTDPSNSGLILQKKPENQEAEEEQDRLTVQKISGLKLAHAHVAYLSACSTAETKAARLSDEVIHVVSGFQVAGFPHVVGCLWPSHDRVCVEIASVFYMSLLRTGTTEWDGCTVASAVRESVMVVRDTDMDTPLLWAQFVHYGA